VLEQAVTWQLLDRNPTDRIRNRRVKLDEDREIKPFTDWAEVEAIAEELHPAYVALPLFLVGTGMRPEEALALDGRTSTRRAPSRASSASTRRDE
jgi:integrase